MYVLGDAQAVARMQALLRAFEQMAGDDAIAIVDRAMDRGGYTDRLRNCDGEVESFEVVVPKEQERVPYIHVRIEFYDDNEEERAKGSVYLSVDESMQLKGEY